MEFGHQQLHRLVMIILIMYMYSAAENARLYRIISGEEKLLQYSAEVKLILQRRNLLPEFQSLNLHVYLVVSTIIVPDDWNVKIEVVPVLGGFGDSRKLNPGRTIDTTRQLVIKGAVVFGGGEVKSY